MIKEGTDLTQIRLAEIEELEEKIRENDIHKDNHQKQLNCLHSLIGDVPRWLVTTITGDTRTFSPCDLSSLKVRVARWFRTFYNCIELVFPDDGSVVQYPVEVTCINAINMESHLIDEIPRWTNISWTAVMAWHLSQGDDTIYTTLQRFTPSSETYILLIRIAIENDRIMLVQQLLNDGYSLITIPDALEIGCQHASVHMVQLLINHQAHPDTCNESPLILASNHNDWEMMRILIEGGCTFQDALYTVVSLGNMDLLKEVLNYGADPCAIDENNRTILHVAAGNQRPDAASMITLLLKNRVPVSHRDDTGQTPLHRGCLPFVDVAVLSVLLEGRAQINVQDHNGQTALDIAYNGANEDDPFSEERIEILLHYGAEINANHEFSLHYGADTFAESPYDKSIHNMSVDQSGQRSLSKSKKNMSIDDLTLLSRPLDIDVLALSDDRIRSDATSSYNYSNLSMNDEVTGFDQWYASQEDNSKEMGCYPVEHHFVPKNIQENTQELENYNQWYASQEDQRSDERTPHSPSKKNGSPKRLDDFQGRKKKKSI